MTFPALLSTVRVHLGRRVDVPRRGTWTTEAHGDRLRIVVELDAAALCANMQDNTPASPFFALCLAWWFEHATGRPADIGVRVRGAAPAEAGALRHWRRSQFLLSELSLLLGSRFRVDPAPSWEWPSLPVLNAPIGPRSSEHARAALSEHALEVQIASSPSLLASFPHPLSAIARQLPLGLFDGRVSEASAWTPGGASQVDLWGCSPDGRVAHLIELKTSGNAHVGILPEALYYARLLHHVRRRRVGGDGAGLAAIRGAERLVMWLVAPGYHPLVHHGGHTPLAWLNAAMVEDRVELRVLPIDLDDEGVRAWRLAEQWPSPVPGPLQ